MGCGTSVEDPASASVYSEPMPNEKTDHAKDEEEKGSGTAHEQQTKDGSRVKVVEPASNTTNDKAKTEKTPMYNQMQQRCGHAVIASLINTYRAREKRRDREERKNKSVVWLKDNESDGMRRSRCKHVRCSQ